MPPGKHRRGLVLQLVEREFLEAGKKRLAGDTARQATSNEVKDLGLGQYAEAFAENDIDGDTLTKLTGRRLSFQITTCR